MRRKLIVLLIMLVSFLSLATANCSGRTLTPQFPQNTSTIDTSLDTEIPDTDTPDPTPTTDLSRLKTTCIEALENVPENINLEGVLVVDIKKREDLQTYLWDWNNGEMNSLGNHSVWALAISPDGQRIAVGDSKLGGFVLFDSKGNRLDVIPMNMLSDLADWLDNEQLAIGIREHSLDTITEAYAIMIVDLATDERQEFLPQYPNLNDDGDEVRWQGYNASKMVINPQRTRLIYPSQGEWGYSLIMWDLTTDREVGRVHQHVYPYLGVNGTAPVWMADGMGFITSAQLRYVIDTPFTSDSYYPLNYADNDLENAYINVDDDLLYIGGHDLVRVGESGEIERLSYLSTTYNASQTYWALSPDETKIAFLLTIHEDENDVKDSLAVLDIDSGIVTNYCVSGYSTPIWSPDGSQIAINQNLNDSYTYKIVDLEQGIAFPISDEEDTNIGGWTESAP